MGNYFKTQVFKSDRPGEFERDAAKMKEFLKVFKRLSLENQKAVLEYARAKLQQQTIDDIVKRDLIRRSSN